MESKDRLFCALDVKLGHVAGECISGDGDGGHIGKCKIWFAR